MNIWLYSLLTFLYNGWPVPPFCVSKTDKNRIFGMQINRFTKSLWILIWVCLNEFKSALPVEKKLVENQMKISWQEIKIHVCLQYMIVILELLTRKAFKEKETVKMEISYADKWFRVILLCINQITVTNLRIYCFRWLISPITVIGTSQQRIDQMMHAEYYKL